MEMFPLFQALIRIQDLVMFWLPIPILLQIHWIQSPYQSDPTDRTGIRLETVTYVCDHLRGHGYISYVGTCLREDGYLRCEDQWEARESATTNHAARFVFSIYDVTVFEDGYLRSYPSSKTDTSYVEDKSHSVIGCRRFPGLSLVFTP